MKTLRLKLKPEHPDRLLVSIFHVIVSVAFVVILALYNFRLFHVAVLAVLNLISAYGLFQMKTWSAKLIAALFLPQIMFGIITLYLSFTMWTLPSTWEIAVFNLSLITYVVLCFISFVYVIAKRRRIK
ncbi:MAG: hypothetical protein PVF15_09925 [Candidatus Bathyarchaeota archaeon]|jgi:hypothetical protein